MCGIFACLGCSLDEVKESINKIQHRGPDNTTIKEINNIIFGFHRLAIIDTSPLSNQPFILDNKYVLICNGEIYNYKELQKKYKTDNDIKSDCFVIPNLYKKYGIDETIKMLDGEFAFVLYDIEKNILHIGRDPYGVRPLFIGYDNKKLFVSSEVKAINFSGIHIEPFKPGKYMSINLDDIKYEYIDYFNIETLKSIELKEDVIKESINELLTEAVKKRLMTNRPLGCLLSGGLDSSLVTSIASRHVRNLDVFSIGLEGSVDITAAKKVAEYLQIKNHHIVNFTVEEGIQAIRDVIYHLESYDITTVRASTPQYLLAKYIKEKTDIKVLLSGEGADELFAGYQYSKDAPNGEELHKDTIRLLNELYMYDNLRTDRTTAGQGLEVRVPFLDKSLTKFVLITNPELRKPSKNIIEKKLLRDSFQDNYLPEEILYRRKEAFSDAVSSKEVSWYQTLCKHIDNVITDEEMKEAKNKYLHNTPRTKEALYYRKIFNEFYEGRDKLIDHYWMPMWQGDITDPSATILKCHEGEL